MFRVILVLAILTELNVVRRRNSPRMVSRLGTE